MKYVAGDFLSSATAWFLYTCFRYYLNPDLMHSQGFYSFGQYLASPVVMLGLVAFPVAMMMVYWLSGYYNEVFRKSRLHELFVTFNCAAVNSLVIFFSALVNDMATDRAYNYEMILLLFVLLFVVVYAVRSAITARASHNIKNRRWQFNTLIIGSGHEASHLGSNLNTMHDSIGYKVVGYVKVPGESNSVVKEASELGEVERLCQEHDVKELIVSLDGDNTKLVLDTINALFRYQLPIKMTPTTADIVLSRVRVNQIAGDPLVDVSGCSAGGFYKNVKRVFDVVTSAFCLVLLSPLYAVVAVLIKLDTPGPVVFRQQRMGLHNKPFTIYKFRSMVADAEKDDVPQLSSDTDPRITRTGVWLRKYRIDETLQFWNVLKGDMSLVGPRPEREYFLRQIMARVPYCALLHQVRPGITSLGMVKYGYAKNVDEMIERLKYDLLYLENMSIINDIKILIYTVKIVLNGRGI